MASSSLQQVGAMLKQHNEVGSSSKPPMYTTGMSYTDWRLRFESFIDFNDPNMRIAIEERYVRPTRTNTGVVDGPAEEKSMKAMTPDERKAYDNERKTYAAISMALPQNIVRRLKHHKIAFDLWEGFEKMCGGSVQYKKNKLDLIKKQYHVFDSLPNESFEDLCSRYSLLIQQLLDGGVTLDTTEVNKKLLDTLPKKWNTRVLLMEKDPDIMDLELEDLIGHLEADLLEMQRKETKSASLVQNPKLYGVDSPISSNTPSVSAFMAGTSASNGSGNGNASTSSSGGTYKNFQGVSPAVAEENATVITAFLAAYDNFLGSKNNTSDLTEEDFSQI